MASQATEHVVLLSNDDVEDATSDHDNTFLSISGIVYTKTHAQPVTPGSKLHKNETDTWLFW